MLSPAHLPRRSRPGPVLLADDGCPTSRSFFREMWDTTTLSRNPSRAHRALKAHTSTQRAHKALKAHTSTQRAHRALKAHTSTQRAHRALKAHTSTQKAHKALKAHTSTHVQRLSLLIPASSRSSIKP